MNGIRQSGPVVRAQGQGGQPQGHGGLSNNGPRRPNVRVRNVCRFCVYCSHTIEWSVRLRSWAACTYEYCLQPVDQPVPLPPVPEGWSICRGCELVFIKDGQRFCGLCQYRTPAGTVYANVHKDHLRRIWALREETRMMLAPHGQGPNVSRNIPTFVPVPLAVELVQLNPVVPAANHDKEEEFNNEEQLLLENMLLDE